MAWPTSWERPDSVRDRLLARAVTMNPIAAAVVTALGLLGCWGLVWLTGGTQGAFSHTFYVPIIFAAVRFGLRGTLVTSVLASVLAGPLVPLDVSTGELQSIESSVTRGVLFLAVGSLVTFSLEARNRATERQLARDVRAALAPFAVRPLDAHLVPLVADVIDHGSFHLLFQPIYALSTGRLLGVEALTRVDVAPYRPPDAWFAAARATGRGSELELAAIARAVEEARELPPGVDLAVNVSPGTLGEPGLAALLADAGRPVTLEITEHASIEDYETIAGPVEALRALGVRIAVDDAGAGIASLRHIVQLAPHVIKLDISLTQGVAASPLRRALAGSLIEFAQQTGAQLLVEGIEDADDLATWTSLGAHAAQGFLIGRPTSLPVPHLSTTVRRAATTVPRPPRRPA